MKRFNIAYFGTPYFSALFLEKIITDASINRLIEVKFVVTRPDKPVGRKQIMTKSRVKLVAEKYNIPVIDDLKKLPVSSYKLQEVDFAHLYAYGGIIQKGLLNKPKLGFLNTHPSLLSKYRGPSPITYPLIFGDKKTGVTLIKLDEEIDHGPIIIQEQITILPSDRRPDLEIKLTNLAFTIFKKMIIQLLTSREIELKTIEQNHKLATFTRMLTKEDGFIPFPTLQKALKNDPLIFEEIPTLIKNYLNNNPQLIENWELKIENSPKIVYDYFRGLYPWPGLWTLIDINGVKKRLKITSLTMKPAFAKASAGKQYNNVTIESVQLEGKNEVDFQTFNKAYNVFE